MNQTLSNAIDEQLQRLTAAMKNQGLWEDNPPSKEQLASQQPFAVDTLTFEQWLQWLFIPKMTEMIQARHFNGLPHRSDIHTMASYSFEKYPQNTKDIIAIIKQTDELLNQFAQPAIH